MSKTNYIYAYAYSDIPNEIRIDYTSKLMSLNDLRKRLAKKMYGQKIMQMPIIKNIYKLNNSTKYDFNRILRKIKGHVYGKYEHPTMSHDGKCLHISSSRYNEINSLLNKYINQHNIIMADDSKSDSDEYIEDNPVPPKVIKDVKCVRKIKPRLASPPKSKKAKFNDSYQTNKPKMTNQYPNCDAFNEDILQHKDNDLISQFDHSTFIPSDTDGIDKYEDDQRWITIMDVFGNYPLELHEYQQKF